jgi:Flp pilus assembly protein TadD
VFYLAAALAYLRFDRERQPGSAPAGPRAAPIRLAWAYFGALALFLLAIGSKTVTATLPGALLVIFWWERGRIAWRDVLPLTPFFVLGAAAGAVTAWYELAVNQCTGPEFNFTLLQRLLLASRAAWFHLGKLLWPAHLAFIYPRWRLDEHAWPQYLFPLAAVAALAGCWALRRRWRGPLAAALWFGGTLFPTLGFFNLYTFRFALVANHYQYLACLGPLVLAAAGLTLAAESPARRGRGTVPIFTLKMGLSPLALGLVAVLAALTWRASAIFADGETLYRATLAENPDSRLAHNNLGVILRSAGRLAEAEAEYRNVIALDPRDSGAHGNLGHVLAQEHRLPEALAELQTAVSLDPGAAEVHSNLGGVLREMGRIDEAIAEFRRAVQIQPKNAFIRFNLGDALAERGDLDSAVAQFHVALRLALAERNAALAQAIAGRIMLYRAGRSRSAARKDEG